MTRMKLVLALLAAACAFEGEDGDDGVDSALSGEGELVPSCADERSTIVGQGGEVQRLQAVGDSILAHNKESRESIADYAAESLGVPLFHFATGGAELRDDGIAEQYEDVGASHVLITGGGNDFAAECSQPVLDGLISPDLGGGLMVDLVDRVTSDGAEAVIVSYYIPSDWEAGCPLFPELLGRYRALAQAREDVAYACTLDVITPDQPDFYDDPVHPSAAGAQAVGSALAKLLDGS